MVRSKIGFGVDSLHGWSSMVIGWPINWQGAFEKVVLTEIKGFGFVELVQ